MPKRAVVAIPKNLKEAAEFLARIGQEQRATDKIQSDLNTKVNEMRAKAMADDEPHQERISQLVEGLFAYAEANRDGLTDGGKRKIVEVPTGTFGWRMTPPSVEFRDAKSVLKSLKALGLERFVRTKEEVDKQAMLREPETAETVNGVSIGQHENFVVKPTELQVEVSVQVDKLRKIAA